MGIARFKERRMSPRRRLTGLLPGRLVIKGEDKDLSCKPIDISPSGMGIIVSREMEEGTEVELLLQDRSVKMKVTWRQHDFGKNDMFRYGLVTKNPEDDLEQIFVATGCLR